MALPLLQSPVAYTGSVQATVAEATGLPVPPAVAPSLFRPSSAPILSDLYGGPDGSNRFSLLAGSDQLLWQAAFAPSDAPDAANTAREAAFFATPPLHGHGGAPVLRLLRWGPGGSRPAPDPAREKALSQALERAWMRFVPEELSPSAEIQARGGAPTAPEPANR
jgi:hypothetical protein